MKFSKEELVPHTLENRSEEEAEFLVIKKPQYAQVMIESSNTLS